MFTKEEFAEYVRDHVLEYLPKAYADAHPMICHVMKIDDRQKTGIEVRRTGEVSSPAIYIDEMYETYTHGGKSLDQAVDLVARLYLDNVGMADVYAAAEMIYDYDYEAVKAYLMGRLVDPQLNRKYLEKIVSRPIGEYALTYQINVSELVRSSTQKPSGSTMVARVTKALLEKWGITEETLFQDAMAADTKREPGLFDMDETVMLMSMFGALPERNLLNEELELPAYDGDIPLFYILTYRDDKFGASLLAHENVMKKVGKLMGGGYFVVPSSIHELLVIRDNVVGASTLLAMCQDINATEVSEEDKLSDRIQHYDVATGVIENAATWERCAKR